MEKSNKKILWYSLAFMAFSTVWGFGNIINGYAEYGGLRSITSWILIFAIYFIPYALMVGELGSAFKNAGGGVSSWVGATVSKRMAYYAGWTYWVVHMPYISQKPSAFIVASGWAIFRDSRATEMSTVLIQTMSFVIFLFALYLSSRGISVVKKLATLAGIASFVMSILFIIMMIAAPAITNGNFFHIDWSFRTFIPTFDVKFFLGLSILVFAVGGCEKISPYVNRMKNPSRDFPRGMIMLALMVAISAILGTIALGMMFDTNNIPSDLMTNGSYYAFQKLGGYYKVGNLFVILFAITNMISQFSVMILSIDAPLRMLLDHVDDEFVPKGLRKQNKYGAYVNGNWLICVIVSVLIILPAFGIGDVNALVKWLIKLNAVCMPLRYLWVFVAYIALKKAGEAFPAEYRFVKSKAWGMILGIWCFGFTAFACMTGIYSEDGFQLIMNIVTPFILVALGLILPAIAKRGRNKGPSTE